MTQSEGLGLQAPATEDPPARSALSVTALTGVVFAGGVAAVVVVALWTRTLPVPDYIVEPDSPWPFVVFVVLGFASEIVFVPVRHGDEFEELTFYEVLVMWGLLIFVPVVALVAPLIGFIFADPLLRRSLVKTLFNVGQYALGSSALVAAYYLIAGDSERFGLQSVLGLLVGALLFDAINLLTLALVLYASDRVPIRQLIREQWTLSLGMAIGSVGVATTVVALAVNTPWLVPFALLPAAGLWYTYRSSARHGEATERNRWMVELSTALSVTTATPTMAQRSADTLRRLFGAQFVALVLPAGAYLNPGPGARPVRRALDTRLHQLVGLAGNTVEEIPAELLPGGWNLGYCVRVDSSDGPGALCLGAEREQILMRRILPWAPHQWGIGDVDKPVMATLAASLGSAIRASEHLTALRDETAKMTAVVDHATDGIVVFGGHGDLSIWSPAMELMTGVMEADARNSEPLPGTDEADNNTTSTIVERFRNLTRPTTTSDTADQPTTPSVDVTITRPDGETRELQVSVVMIDEADPSTPEEMTVLTVRDMTQERRVERMKSDFIATVSHELRTPITPIKGYAQLLSGRWDRMAEAKRSEVLATIVDRADHLSRLVDDLLLASRVADADTAKLDVRLTEVDLVDLVNETVHTFPNLAQRITVSGPTSPVACDRVRAIQCLSNLIGNAGKYAPGESPIGVVTGTTKGGRWATVEVIDHGRGIPADELDKVFDRFYRVEDPMTMTTGGSGLGLFISRELAHAMGGDIEVESTLGVGSRFTLQLPVSSGEKES